MRATAIVLTAGLCLALSRDDSVRANERRRLAEPPATGLVAVTEPTHAPGGEQINPRPGKYSSSPAPNLSPAAMPIAPAEEEEEEEETCDSFDNDGDGESDQDLACPCASACDSGVETFVQRERLQ